MNTDSLTGRIDPRGCQHERIRVQGRRIYRRACGDRHARWYRETHPSGTRWLDLYRCDDHVPQGASGPDGRWTVEVLP